MPVSLDVVIAMASVAFADAHHDGWWRWSEQLESIKRNCAEVLGQFAWRVLTLHVKEDVRASETRGP